MPNFSPKLKHLDELFKAPTLPPRDDLKLALSDALRTDMHENVFGWMMNLESSKRKAALSNLNFQDKKTVTSALKFCIRPELDDTKRVELFQPMIKSGKHMRVISLMGFQKRDLASKMIKNFQTAGGNVDDIGRWLAGAGGILKAANRAPTGTDGFWDDFTNAVGSVAGAVADTAKEVAESVIDAAEAVGSAAVDAWSALMEATATVLDAMKRGAVALSSALKNVVSKGKEYVEAVVNALINAGQTVSMILTALVAGDDATLKAILEHFVNKSVSWFKQTVTWLSECVKDVASRVFNLIGTIGKKIRDMLNVIYVKGGELVRKFMDMLERIGHDMVMAFREAASCAKRIFYAVENWLSSKAAPFIEKVIHSLIQAGELFIVSALAIVNASKYLLPLYRYAEAIPMSYLTWKNYKKVTDIPNFKVFTADSNGKYVIFSDLHRGGILEKNVNCEKAHLNQDLYIQTLQNYYDQGYTLIENGDSEEFWNAAAKFVEWLNPAGAAIDIAKMDVNTDKRTLAGIHTLHKKTYDMIAKFHADNRFIKIRGNHDASLNHPIIVADYVKMIGNKPITVYDAVLIPAKKAISGKKIRPASSGTTFGKSVGRKIPNLNLGNIVQPIMKLLDPVNDVLIMHGHQIDFYNADEHNFLGKTLVATASIPAQLAGVDAIRDESSDKTFVPESVRSKVGEMFPALSNQAWKNYLINKIPNESFKPAYENFSLGSSLPLFDRKALIETAMKDIGQHFNVSIVMGHTHDTKLFSVRGDLGNNRVFANSGTGGMWEGAVSCIDIANQNISVIYHLNAADIDGKNILQRLDDALDEAVGDPRVVDKRKLA